MSGARPPYPQGMYRSLATTLTGHGIQPSAQRLAVARYVLATGEHPSADKVLDRVRGTLPMISRATVYNTLNLMVRKGLLRQLVIAEGRVVYDPNLERHHHFIDDRSGRIDDLPWDAVELGAVRPPAGYAVREVAVILRGKKVAPRRSR